MRAIHMSEIDPPWYRRGALPNGPAVAPLADDDRIRADIARIRKHTDPLDSDAEALVERLAHRCRHTPEPCQRCTELALWAVLTLTDSPALNPSKGTS